MLGFAPGVGAIYNGQYAKGLIHAVVFGLLVSFESTSAHGFMEPLVGIMIGAWVIYQAFEAYHTARKRRYGLQVEEFSSLFDMRPTHGRFPVGALLLIVLGFILLLNTTDIISLEVFARYWPALLIVFGVYMLYNRLNPASHQAVSQPIGSGAAPSDGSARR
jgi:putative Mn2+ efflux pump MntP